jgi:hypothetical protein
MDCLFDEVWEDGMPGQHFFTLELKASKKQSMLGATPEQLGGDIV